MSAVRSESDLQLGGARSRGGQAETRRAKRGRLSARSRLSIYVISIHLVVVAFAVVVIEERAWLLALEAALAVSVSIGLVLVRSAVSPLSSIRGEIRALAESDFSSRLRPVGQPEVDELIRVYNHMLDRLRGERLRTEEQHFFLEKVLGASPAGMLTLDFDGRVDMVNASAVHLLQRPEEQLLGRRLDQLPSPLGETLGGLWTGRSALAALGGRQLRCSRTEFFDRGFARSFLLIEELTEELRASEREAHEKLIRLISHEVNNSVAAVMSLLDSFLGYTDQLAGGDRGDVREGLEVALARMEHLNSFTRALAEVVRLPAPVLRPCDLQQLLRDIITLLGPELSQRAIQIVWKVGEPLAPIPMDKNQMEQVLVNVLKNAIEAIGREGRIELRLGNEDGRLVLEVRDTGGGIPPEVQQKLFSPFLSTKRDGRGLGLTLTREILTEHRFGFALENLPGGGAKFSIRF